MKLREIIENIIDMPEKEQTGPVQPANTSILSGQVQKYIDKAMQDPSVQGQLSSAKAVVQGPNVLLTTTDKMGKTTTATLPMSYLSKYFKSPKTLAGILLKKNM
jgi:Lhr-like helicase